MSTTSTTASINRITLTTAVAVFAASPNAETLLALNLAAVPMLAQNPLLIPAILPAAPKDEQPWQPVASADLQDFYEIRVECDAVLNAAETSCVAATLGYALTTLAGEKLSEPEVTVFKKADTSGTTVLEFYFDSTKCRGSHFDRAFDDAASFVFSGSPIRGTNRSGMGTKGTRLAKGIGENRCGVEFFVR